MKWILAISFGMLLGGTGVHYYDASKMSAELKTAGDEAVSLYRQKAKQAQNVYDVSDEDVKAFMDCLGIKND